MSVHDAGVDTALFTGLQYAGASSVTLLMVLVHTQKAAVVKEQNAGMSWLAPPWCFQPVSQLIMCVTLKATPS